MATVWHTAFKVLAHELRTPVGVVAGCARLLGDGHLDEAGRVEVLGQLQRAAQRLGQFGVQSSELARWLEPRVPPAGDLVPVTAIIAGARSRAAAPDRVSSPESRDAEGLCVRTPDRGALSGALATIIDAVAREVADPNAPIGVIVRAVAGADNCDVLVGVPDQINTQQHLPPDDEPRAFNLERGGLGLQLFLSVAILDAHRAQLWTSDHGDGFAGVRLPVTTQGLAA